MSQEYFKKLLSYIFCNDVIFLILLKSLEKHNRQIRQSSSKSPRQLAMQSCVLCSFVRCGTSNQIEKKKKKKKEKKKISFKKNIYSPTLAKNVVTVKEYIYITKLNSDLFV